MPDSNAGRHAKAITVLPQRASKFYAMVDIGLGLILFRQPILTEHANIFASTLVTRSDDRELMFIPKMPCQGIVTDRKLLLAGGINYHSLSDLSQEADFDRSGWVYFATQLVPVRTSSHAHTSRSISKTWVSYIASIAL
jgi:hypothetical protein